MKSKMTIVLYKASYDWKMLFLIKGSQLHNLWLRKNYLCDFQRQTFYKIYHENILTEKVQHEPVLKTQNCILFTAFDNK